MDKRSRFHPVFSNHSKNFGFTLIILLLLLAVVGVMISYRVITLQQKEQEAKIEKTALQIQGILEAGEIYNKAKGKWPDPENPKDFILYLPLGKRVLNPWGKEYVISKDEANNYFRVSTDALQENIAKSIVALSPNASVQKGTSMVVAEVAGIAADISSTPVVILDSRVQTFNRDDLERWHKGAGTYYYLNSLMAAFLCPKFASTGELMTGKLMVIPYNFNIGSKTAAAKNYPTPNIKQIGLIGAPQCFKTMNPSEFSCSFDFAFQAQVCASPGDLFMYQACNAKLEKLGGPIGPTGDLLQDDGSISLLIVEYCQAE